MQKPILIQRLVLIILTSSSLFCIASMGCGENVAQPVNGDQRPQSAALRSPTVAATSSTANSPGKLDTSRYPFRLPDWLWQQDAIHERLQTSVYNDLLYDVEVFNALSPLKRATLADAKEREIALSVASAFSLLDLTRGRTDIVNARDATRLVVRIDPAFDAEAQKTIELGAQIFMQHALDDDVIATAIAASSENPLPGAPAEFEKKEGQPVLDPDGKKVVTDAYRRYLNYRIKPRDATAFKAHLKDALSTPTGDPALLVVSKYTGNVWWGRSDYEFYHNDLHRLRRLVPAAGYFSIALNADKLTQGVDQWNDPAFWASKIAHEMLHNLGYWHPDYADPAERDKYNQGNEKAFIVAYEQAILAKSISKN